MTRSPEAAHASGESPPIVTTRPARKIVVVMDSLTARSEAVPSTKRICPHRVTRQSSLAPHTLYPTESYCDEGQPDEDESKCREYDASIFDRRIAAGSLT